MIFLIMNRTVILQVQTFILELKDTSDSTRRKNLSVEVIVESVEEWLCFFSESNIH